MSKLHYSLLSSVSDLRAVAPAWDDLWLRSEATSPTLRAELVAQWVEQFAPQTRFRAIVVEDQGRFVAALPLFGRKTRGWLEIGSLPSNEWSPCGDLLLDPQVDTGEALQQVTNAMNHLPWPLLWLDAVNSEAPRWQAMLSALDRSSIPSDLHQRFQIGWIPSSGDWSQYRSSWTAKHRSNMGRYTRRLEERGELQLRLETSFADDEAVEKIMTLGFQIEDSNWKGREGSSVLRSAGMFDYLLSQAKQLARWGQLQLAFLQLDGKPIAFTYAWNAKGVFHGFKTGYDEQYSADSPGQLLMHGVLQQMYEDPQMRGMDCLGPVSASISRWKPNTYSISRLVIAPHQMLGRGLLCAYKYLAPQWRRWRRGASS